MIYVKDFGAVGDGVTDDRAAIQAAFTSASTGDVVWFDSRYRIVGSLVPPAGVTLWGPGTLIQGPGSDGGVRIVNVSNPGVTIDGLTLDGNKANQTADEHRAGVFVTAANCTIRRVMAQNFTGDGLYFYAGANALVVDDCTCTDNGRNGMTLGGTIDGVVVKNSKFLRNVAQQLDTEPVGAAHVDNVEIFGCELDGGLASQQYVLTIAGGATGQSVGWRAHHNRLAGGIEVVWADNVRIDNNTAINYTQQPCLTVYRSCSGIDAEDNLWSLLGPGTGQTPIVALTGATSGQVGKRIRISRNRMIVRGRAQSFGVFATGAESLSVIDNHMTGPAASGVGVYLRATLPDHDWISAVVRGNTIEDFPTYGLEIDGNGAAKMLHADIRNNTFDGCAAAMSLNDGTGSARDVTVAGSTLIACSTEIAHAPVGALTTTGDVRRWIVP